MNSPEKRPNNLRQETREDASKSIEYNLNLNMVNVLQEEDRATVSGNEHTLTLLIPPKGCGYNCRFCSIKNISNPNFEVHGEAGQQAASRAADQTDRLLISHGANTLKLFNAGNILYGTERSGNAELHQVFWERLLPKLEKLDNLKALEIEVRLDEFSGKQIDHNTQPTPRAALLARILDISRKLKKMGKQLRCILALEYIEGDLLAEQNKFSKNFVSQQDPRANPAILFMEKQGIEWLGYSMLGGRKLRSSMSKEEAVQSAVQTTLYGLTNGAREVIINCQYLDPVNQAEQQMDNINFYIPTEKDMVDTLRGIFLSWNKVSNYRETGVRPRIRLTTDKEDVIKGTIGPKISSQFRKLIDGFNSSTDQYTYFDKHLSGMDFNEGGL